RFWSLNPGAEGRVRLSGIYMLRGAYYIYTSPDWLENWADHFVWPVEFKAARNIDVHLWLAPGSVTEAGAQADVEQANEIMNLNARRDACALFYNYQTTITQLTEDQWAQIAGADGVVNAAERAVAAEANGGATYDGSADNVYYGGLFEEGVPGLMDLTGEAGFVDPAGSETGRALARVLGQLVTGGAIHDTHADTENQGAKQPQNLYNPFDPGDRLTADQCGLFPQ
ncbi:MAG: hypothetical protein ACTSXZ_02395, partial [Alphaproteobacteria bacterium]